MFFNLCRHKDDFKLNAEWPFFSPFLLPPMAKACVMPLEVQLKSLFTNHLQFPYKDQIISPLGLFHYCTGYFKNIKFFFASEECVAET